MAETQSSDSSVREVGDESTEARPEFAAASTGRNFRASSERPRGIFADYPGPLLRRGRSTGSRIQPAPAPARTGPQGVETNAVTFDPEELLQEGLGEWQDRAISLRSLRKASSVRAHSQAFSGLEETPSFRYFERQQSARRSHESYGTEGSTQSAVQDSTGDERDGDNFQFSEASEDGMYGGVGRMGPATPGFETPGNSLLGAKMLNEPDMREEEGRSSELSQDFYTTLAEAPQASLIHLVSLYHQTLLRHGLVDEAEKIANVFSGFQSGGESVEGEQLQGMDLLLKEGLLKYLLSVTPYLPPIPIQVVRFKGLTCSRKVKVEKGYETMFTKVKGLLGGPLRRPPIVDVTVLKDVTGYLMPGTLTLVLGPPGCGKSALLRFLGGRPNRKGTSLTGTVTYNGKNVRDLKYQRLATLSTSEDVHIPSLTVRETLEFARDCSQAYRAKHYSEELRAVMGEALKHGQDPKLELNLSMMGLKRVADRPVGSPTMPTLTEGERHRLTKAETIAGTYAVYIFEQLNAGVDSLTFDLVTSIRIYSRVRQTTFIGAVLSASAEVFDLFDRIILLDGGQVMFQGPRQDVLPYFETLGYFKPKHMTTSEFLTDVTTPEGVRYLRPGFPRFEHDDFVASFLLSPTFRDIRRVVNSPDTVQELWVQGNKPLGLGFTESRANNGSGLASSVSTLVAGVVEKGGSLAEVSMDHTSIVSPGDEVVAVGGAGGLLKYFKTDDRQVDSSLTGGLAEAIDGVEEPVRLQLERPLREPITVLPCAGRQFEQDYVLDFKQEVLTLLRRELKVAMRNRFGLQIRFAQVLIMSVYCGVVFFRVKGTPDQLDMNLLRSIFFISVLNMTLFNLGQLPALMEDRAIYYKQQGASFFRPQSYLLAKIFGGLPFTFLEATLWSLVVYFMTGLSLKEGGWHFWVYYIIIFLTALNGASLVRFMAFFSPTREAANALIGVLVAIFILFAGFLVPRFQCPHYWIWAYYLDPLQWAITALVINEYNSKTYSIPCSDVNVANLPQCQGRPTNTVGHAYLARGQFYTSNSWIAVSIAAILGWIVLLNFGAYFSLARLRHISLGASPLMEAKLSSSEQHVVKEKDEEWGQEEAKLSLSPIPVTLSWHELSYDIMIPAIGHTRTILNYVSGWGKPGEMVAILGGAGSGKTTLLNCLAGRKVSLPRMGGQILVNGYSRVPKTFVHVVGYVEDISSYPPYMTVREGIEFSAAMRLGKKTSSPKRKEFVEEVMQLVQINHISNMLLLSLGSEEVSLEQATRLAIATELAGNPSVMFLDEPIRGLDSHASRHIIECLKRVANSGRLVLVALAQPSPRQLTAFNMIQLMKRGGDTVYFGPVGTDAEYLRTYFESIPGTPPCPPNKSPVTHAIDVIGDGINDRKGQRDYAFEYRVSGLALQNHIQLQNLRRSKGQSGPELLDFGYRATYPSMAWEIMKKMQRFYWRNVNYNFGRMIFSLVLGLILGSVYFNIDPDTTVKMNVKAQSLFITCILLGISSAQNVIPQVLRFSATMPRDHASQQYSITLYSIAWGLLEVEYLALAVMIFCFVFCLMAQIAVHSAAQFFRFYFVLFEFCLAITFLGVFIVVISPMPQIAAVLVPIVIGFWTATGGSVVPKRKILKTVIWIFWTNPLQYTLNALTSISFFCDTNKATCLDSGRNTACLTTPTACPSCDCTRLKDAGNAFTWTTLQFNRSLNNHRIPLDIMALFLFCVFFRLATASVLTYKKRKVKAW